MKDHSSSLRSESPSLSRRAVLAGLAALGVAYSMPGLFQVNEAMAEPARKHRSEKHGHPKHERHSRKSRHSKSSRHSKTERHHRRSKASRPGPSRRSKASRMPRRADSPRRPI